MSTPISKPTVSRQRTKVVAASVAIAAIGVAGGIALTGSAQAGPSDQPAISFNTVGPTFGPEPTFGTVGPTFGTIPDATFGTVGPTFGTIPDATFGTISPPDVTPPDSMEATGTNPSGADTSAPNVDDPAAPDGYTLDITAAQINCDGTIHVEYATTATPEPPNAADHLVVFNPTSNPVDFHVVETVGNPANGAFAFEQLASNTDTYRVFVIALFEPTNLEGPKLVDQTDVLLAPNCA